MRPRARRILAVTLLGVLLLAAALATAAWVLLGTGTGLRFLVSRLDGFVPGELTVGGVEGAVRGPLVLRNLRYGSETLEVSVGRLALDWTLRDLPRRTVDVPWLEAADVHVAMRAGEETTGTRDLVDIDLGWQVRIHKAAITGLAVRTADGEPVRIARIDLAARTDGTTVVVERLAAEGPTLALGASGRLTPTGDYPLELALEGWFQPEAAPRLAARGRFAGSLRHLQADLDVSEPTVARIVAVAHDPLVAPSLDGTVTLQGLDTRLFDPDAPTAVLSGTVRAVGPPDEVTGTADLQVDAADIGVIRVAGPFRRRGTAWSADGARLTTADGRLDARLSAVVRVDETVSFEADAAWDRLAWPLEGDLVVDTRRGRARARGTADRWDVSGSADLRVPDTIEGRLALEGEGTSEGLAVAASRFDTLGGTVRGTGRVAWSPAVRWDLRVSGTGLDPAALEAPIGGRLDVEGVVAGRLEGDVAVGQVSPLAFRGILGEAPLEGGMEAFLHRGEVFEVSSLRADWGGATLEGSGLVSEPLDLSWRAEVPDLSRLVEGASGRAWGAGRLAGPYAAPRVEGEAGGGDLAWSGVRVAALEARVRAGLQPEDPLEIDLVAREVRSGEALAASEVRVRSEGTGGDHRLEATATGGRTEVSLAASGSVAPAPSWSGTLARLEVTEPEAGTWSLDAPAAVALAAETQHVEGLCLLSPPARLCLSGRAEAGGWTAAGGLTDLPLARFEAWLPEEVRLAGGMAASFEARSDAGGAILGSADLSVSDGAILTEDAEGRPVEIPVGPVQVRGVSSPAGVDARVEATLPGRGSLRGEVSTPAPPGGAGFPPGTPITGRLVAGISDLGFADPLLPLVEGLSGRLDADLQVAGSANAPGLSGHAVVENGRAGLPNLGITLEEVQLRLAGDGSPTLALQGRARSGEGTVTLAGRVAAVPSPETPIEIRVTGQDVLASDTAAMRAVVSPDLTLATSGEVLSVRGTVAVPEAMIDLGQDAPPEAILPSADVVLVGPAPAEEPASPPLGLGAEIRVVLGEEVRLEGQGIEARVDGSLLVVQPPEAPARATGTIRIVEGTYTAYGQDLRVESGRLYYAGGPVDDPGLALRASRTATDGTVAGVEVEGTLGQPRLTLWSRPPMEESDQLAYLLLGRPLDQATPSEGSFLGSAATSLGLKGGGMLAGRLAARFGLEEARIETTGGDRESAALVVGTSVSRRLFVSYGFGLFEPVQIVRVRYRLGEHWMLRTESGRETSVDLFYTIERGRGLEVAVPEEDPAPPR